MNFCDLIGDIFQICCTITTVLLYYSGVITGSCVVPPSAHVLKAPQQGLQKLELFPGALLTVICIVMASAMPNSNVLPSVGTILQSASEKPTTADKDSMMRMDPSIPFPGMEGMKFCWYAGNEAMAGLDSMQVGGNCLDVLCKHEDMCWIIFLHVHPSVWSYECCTEIQTYPNASYHGNKNHRSDERCVRKHVPFTALTNWMLLSE